MSILTSDLRQRLAISRRRAAIDARYSRAKGNGKTEFEDPFTDAAEPPGSESHPVDDDHAGEGDEEGYDTVGAEL